MSNLRCNQQQLSMTESAPVCQHWSYASDHEMKVMLDTTYFLSAYDRLRPGDTIRIVQMKDKNIHARDNDVVAFANVTVLKSGKVNIDIHIDKLVEIGGLPEMENAEAETGEGTVGGNEIASLKFALGSLQEGFLSLSGRVEGLEEVGISESTETIDVLVQELKTAISTLEDTQSGLLKDIASFKEDREPEDASVEVPVSRWNPGQKVHEAVIGDGDDRKVLFSHEDKKKVTSWIESAAGQKE